MTQNDSMTPHIRRTAIPTPEFGDYFGTSLADFYVSRTHRWFMYAAIFILSGLAAFGGLWLYDIGYSIYLYNDIPLTFKGMYAWHTAANFALSVLMVDILVNFIPGGWGTYHRRTVGKTWLVLLFAFPLGFLVQRTLVYQMVDLYYPRWHLRHELYPAERPELFAMFLFMLPFWIVITHIAIRLTLGMQARYEELLRVRIDTILEERAHLVEASPRETPEAPDDKDHIDLPLDADVGPIARSQIGHVTAEDHYLRIHYRIDGVSKETLIRMSLKALSARLPTDQFIRIHRSHLINLQWIAGVKRAGREVRLTLKYGDADLPVSRYRLPELLPVLDQYLDRAHQRPVKSPTPPN